MYGRLEEADPLVTSLSADKDPILRRSGMYTLAMAYCGTGNNQAIRKLLHVAVSSRCQSGLHSLAAFFSMAFTPRLLLVLATFDGKIDVVNGTTRCQIYAGLNCLRDNAMRIRITRHRVD